MKIMQVDNIRRYATKLAQKAKRRKIRETSLQSRKSSEYNVTVLAETSADPNVIALVFCLVVPSVRHAHISAVALTEFAEYLKHYLSRAAVCAGVYCGNYHHAASQKK